MRKSLANLTAYCKTLQDDGEDDRQEKQQPRTKGDRWKGRTTKEIKRNEFQQGSNSLRLIPKRCARRQPVMDEVE